MKPAMGLHILVVATALFGAGAASAANLLWNPDFATDTSAWANEDPSTVNVTFSPVDANGAPTSGSIRIANFHPGPGQGAGVSQCIGPASAGASYTYGAKVLLPTGQARSGNGRIGLRWKSGAGCTGSNIDQPRSSSGTPSNTWAAINGDTEVAPTGTVSVEYVAFASKVEAGGELVVQFDDIFFEDGLAAPPPNHQGLWWRAPAGAESGWGVNLAHQGDTIFATWFTYGPDGKPQWLAVVAAKTGANVYSGTLFRTTGPAFSAVPFDPALVVETTAGTATFTFTGPSHGQFSYTLDGVTQSKPITRQVFGNPVPRCTAASLAAYTALSANYQDLWWYLPAGQESGWGINLTHQGDTIFATWFTYDADGKGWWLAVVAQRTAPGVYAGELFTTTGPAFNAVPFDPASVIETVVGSATFAFTDGNTGSFEYTVNGTAQTKAITRQIFAPPGTVCQ